MRKDGRLNSGTCLGKDLKRRLNVVKVFSGRIFLLRFFFLLIKFLKSTKLLCLLPAKEHHVVNKLIKTDKQYLTKRRAMT